MLYEFKCFTYFKQYHFAPLFLNILIKNISHMHINLWKPKIRKKCKYLQVIRNYKTKLISLAKNELLKPYIITIKESFLFETF